MEHPEILLIDNDYQDIMLIEDIIKEYDSRLNLRIIHNYVDAINFLFLNSDAEILSKLKLILVEAAISNNKGKDILHKVKEHVELRKIPLILLTRTPNTNEIDNYYDEYVNLYLYKPESKAEFSHLIKMILKFWMEFVSLPEHAWS